MATLSNNRREAPQSTIANPIHCLMVLLDFGVILSGLNSVIAMQPGNLTLNDNNSYL